MKMSKEREGRPDGDPAEKTNKGGTAEKLKQHSGLSRGGGGTNKDTGKNRKPENRMWQNRRRRETAWVQDLRRAGATSSWHKIHGETDEIVGDQSVQ